MIKLIKYDAHGHKIFYLVCDGKRSCHIGSIHHLDLPQQTVQQICKFLKRGLYIYSQTNKKTV